jgi:CheY-like chemotaxis protein
MGGEIKVSSEHGKGTTFTFSLDFKDSMSNHDSKLPDESKSAIVQWQELKKEDPYSILVVDDNPINLKVAGLVLKKFGFTPTFANSGFESIEILKEQTFDVIFMDSSMPEMNGDEATRLIKKMESCKDIPIVTFTANAMEKDKSDCLKNGASAYLCKPIDKEELAKVLLKLFFPQ